MRGAVGRRVWSGMWAFAMVTGLLFSWPAAAAAVGISDLTSVVYYETEFDDGNFDPETQGPASGMQGLQDVVATPDGKHVYASGGLDDAIARFSRDSTTGLLTFLGETTHNPPAGPLIESARKLAVSPDSKHLYATAITSNAVSVFTRVEATGDLVFVQSLVDDQGGVTGLGGAKAAAVSPDGRQVYVVGFADDAVVTFDRDATTGVLTHSQTLFDGVGGVDGLDSADDVIVSPDGKHVYVVSGKSLPNHTQGDDAIAAFARDTDPISPTFGELTFVEALFDGVGGVDGLHEVQNVDISADGRHVYTAAETDSAIGTDPNDDWLAVFSRNATTGRLSLVETHDSVDRPECGITSFSSTTADVKVDGGGVFVYATDPRENTLVELVRSSGSGTLSSERATCKGAKRDGSDFENELASGLLTPVTLEVIGGDVYVGGFSPAAVNVFGTPSAIEIGKDAVPDDPQDFEFDIEFVDPQAGPISIGPIALDDDADPTLPFNPITVGPLEPGDYDLVEQGVPGWALDAIHCTDPSGGTTTDVPNRTANVGLGLGETVSCTFTNSPAPTGTIVIAKDAIPDDPEVFNFVGLPPPAGDFDLDDDPASAVPNSMTFTGVPAGSHEVVETIAPGWDLTGINCTDPDGGTTVDLGGRQATIDLDDGETVTCTFTNELFDRDDDGVGDDVEDGAPNGGDGNRDGTKDSEQGNVASLPNSADGQYFTFATPAGTELRNVRAVPNPDPANSPPGVDFPFGFWSFEVTGLTPGASVPIRYILPGDVTVPFDHWLYGPEPGNPADHFWVFAGALTDVEYELKVTDGDRGDLDLAADGVITDPGGPGVPMDAEEPPPPDDAAPEQFGLHDVPRALWNLPNPSGEGRQFFYGNPFDQGFAGDWDCDGIATPGVYRDGRVYLRNTNSPGAADVVYGLGDPGDVALAGDFDGDGCDTVSVYRPEQARFYVFNDLTDGTPDTVYTFGDPGDAPFVGDFDGDGVDTFGKHRASTGGVFLRNAHAAGIADVAFTWGNPGDVVAFGDWDGDGDSTPGLVRSPAPAVHEVYIRNVNSAGIGTQTTTLPNPGLHTPVVGVFFES